VFGGAAFVAGKLGNALNLNNGTAGTGGKYAELPSNATLDNVQEGNYTISAWFYPYSVPPDVSTDNHHWAVVAKAGFHMGLVYQFNRAFSMRHYLTGNVLEAATSTTTYPINAWHHVAGVVNKTAGTVTLYVNGAVAASATFTGGTAARDYGATPFRIGKASGNWAADGKVDQVRIYDRALSGAEVGDLFHETSGSPGAALRVGLAGTIQSDENNIGLGPGNDAVGPLYKMVNGNPTNSGDFANINDLISRANQNDVTLVLNLAGPRSVWTDAVGTYTDRDGETQPCSKYNAGTYQAQLDRFSSNAALQTALTNRRAVVFVVDEPFAKYYCGSLSPSVVNQMSGFVKARWPGAITIVRAPANFMKGGWDGQGPLTSNFWTKVDYGWAQYDHVAELAGTPAQFYQGQKDTLGMVNLGMIPSMNLWNGGNTACWDGRNNGTSSGRIYGSEESSTVRGTFESCASNPNPSSAIRWVASPALLRAAMDAAVTDPDAPFFDLWTHISSHSPGSTQGFGVYELRQDFEDALDDMITTGATRSSWNGWRQAKP
jgi:hypothetical protein